MTVIPRLSSRCTQYGAVLFMVLVFALLLNIIAASVVHTASLQLRMSGNLAIYEEALTLADSVAREVLEDVAQFDLAAPVGSVRCLPAAATASCTELAAADLQILSVSDEFTIEYRLERLAPLQQLVTGRALWPDVDGMVSVALFEIRVQVAAMARPGVLANLAWGVAVPIGGGAPVRAYWREPGVDTL